MGEASVLNELRLHFSGENWAFFDHVPDSTGYAKNRTIDGLAMGLWPSRGLELHACEIKCDRGDWLREMKQPAKAEGFFVQVDRFWLVTADKDVAKADEIPKGWGLLAMKPDGGFRCVVQAPALTPAPITRNFLAAILRRAFDKSPAAELLKEAVASAVKEEYDRMSALHDKHALSDAAAMRMRMELDSLKSQVAEFEANAGIKIGRWDCGQVGKVVAAFLAEGADSARRRLADEANQLDACAALLRAGVDQLMPRAADTSKERPKP